jgi:hypothetical protein
MIRSVFAVALLLVAAPAAAASTLSFAFGGADSDAASFVYTDTGSQGSLTLTLSSQKFFIAPSTLTNFSQTTAVGTLRRRAPGIGIVGGGDNLQIDTNSPGTVQNPQREALLLTGDKRFSIHSLTLSIIDRNDTLQLYGVRPDGTLRNLGFGSTFSQTPENAGTIRGGLDGSVTGLVLTPPTGDNVTAAFSFPATPLFTQYLLTTRIGGDVQFGGDTGNGVRLDGMTAALPEPGTWALLIAGFGMAGAAMRRQRKTAAA